MTLEIHDEPEEPPATRRLPIVSGSAAALVCALFLAVVVIPPSPGRGPAPVAPVSMEPLARLHDGAVSPRVGLTIGSAHQDGWLLRLCGDPPVYMGLPPSELATVPVALTTHVFDRTGEHLLYTLADEPRYLIAIGAVPKRMGDGPIARPAPNFGAMDLQRGSAPHEESCSRELDLAWRGSTSHLR